MATDGSALPSLSLERMIENIKARLSVPQPLGRAAFTLIVGSGFSFPIIPPAGLMLHDIVWWLYLRGEDRGEEYFGRPGTGDVPREYRERLWQEIHEACGGTFALKDDGLPADAAPKNVAEAYKALMSGCSARGLHDPQQRRQYLRDVVRRAGQRINPAHLYLCSILRAQDLATWRRKSTFCRTVFTTNFDPLLQRGLQLADKLYYMSDRPYVLEPPEDDAHDAIHLIYSHGSVHRYFLVNSESEFEETRARNATVLAPYFQRHGVIVMGYGGWPDATMQALQECHTFDGNLYWCDRYSAAEAPQRLRPEVVELLRRKAGIGFYVPIRDADAALQALHRGLGLEAAPDFLLRPLAPLRERFEAIEVTTASSSEERSEPPSARPASEPWSLATIKDQVLQRLAEASRVFDAPTDVPTQVAKRMTDALALAMAGNLDGAIGLWTAVIDMADAPAHQKAKALYNRGVVLDQKGETQKAIADYTAVVEMADAPAQQKAGALNNRGVARGEKGEREKEIADYTAVVEMADASAEDKAKALFNRGVAWGKKGEPDKEIADYTAVVEMADAPADEKASALINRGVTWGQKGERDKEIADYTAVVEMADAPADEKASALLNRGVTWGQKGETDKEIADYTAVVGMPDAPADHKARALVARGVTWGEKGETDKAFADYTAVVEMADAPADLRAKARKGRDRLLPPPEGPRP